MIKARDDLNRRRRALSWTRAQEMAEHDTISSKQERCHGKKETDNIRLDLSSTLSNVSSVTQEQTALARRSRGARGTKTTSGLVGEVEKEKRPQKWRRIAARTSGKVAVCW